MVSYLDIFFSNISYNVGIKKTLFTIKDGSSSKRLVTYHVEDKNKQSESHVKIFECWFQTEKLFKDNHLRNEAVF